MVFKFSDTVTYLSYPDLGDARCKLHIFWEKFNSEKRLFSSFYCQNTKYLTLKELKHLLGAKAFFLGNRK